MTFLFIVLGIFLCAAMFCGASILGRMAKVTDQIARASMRRNP